MSENDYTSEGLPVVTWDTINGFLSDLAKEGQNDSNKCRKNLLETITGISAENPAIGEYLMAGFNKNETVMVTHLVVLYNSLKRQAESFKLRDSLNS